MLDSKPIEKILFLDIETTSKKEKFSELTENQKELFLNSLRNKGASELVTDEDKERFYSEKAPIFAADWGKIICISVGRLIKNETGYSIKLISFADADEKTLLNNFVTKLNVYLNDTSFILCSHNGFVFDWPVVAKRLIINGIPLPKILDYSDKKPWEISHIDTKKVWSFGVFDSNTSLDTLCDIFNVKSPKDGISGKDVKDVFYKDKDGLELIKKYCEKDVIALAQVFLKIKCMTEEVTVDIQTVSQISK